MPLIELINILKIYTYTYLRSELLLRTTDNRYLKKFTIYCTGD